MQAIYVTIVVYQDLSKNGGINQLNIPDLFTVISVSKDL